MTEKRIINIDQNERTLLSQIMQWNHRPNVTGFETKAGNAMDLRKVLKPNIVDKGQTESHGGQNAFECQSESARPSLTHLVWVKGHKSIIDVLLEVFVHLHSDVVRI